MEQSEVASGCDLHFLGTYPIKKKSRKVQLLFADGNQSVSYKDLEHIEPAFDDLNDCVAEHTDLVREIIEKCISEMKITADQVMFFHNSFNTEPGFVKLHVYMTETGAWNIRPVAYAHKVPMTTQSCMVIISL